eukprot:SAG11_NODE_219_length_12168_cov_5.600083_11_plen_72_part_00
MCKYLGKLKKYPGTARYCHPLGSFSEFSTVEVKMYTDSGTSRMLPSNLVIAATGVSVGSLLLLDVYGVFHH